MPHIRFSHEYTKSLLAVHDGIWKTIHVRKAQLLHVFIEDAENLHRSFIAYDTEIDSEYSTGGYYDKLPTVGKVIILLFKKIKVGRYGGHNLMTTIRPYTSDKYEYYKKDIGKEFDVNVKGGFVERC